MSRHRGTSNAAPAMTADGTSAGQPTEETPRQWRDRVLAQHGPIPEHVVTRVRRVFAAAAQDRRTA